MGTIGLFILIELASLVGVKIVVNVEADNIVLNLGNKGFYLSNTSLLDKFASNSSGVEEILEKVLTYIPGINMIFTKLFLSKYGKDLVKYLEENNGLIPMTAQEKNNYAKLKGRRKKVKYINETLPKQYEESRKSIEEARKLVLNDEIPSIQMEVEPIEKIHELLPVINVEQNDEKKLTKTFENNGSNSRTNSR